MVLDDPAEERLLLDLFRDLEIVSNGASKIPDHVTDKVITKKDGKLLELDLSYQDLKILPNSLFELTSLETLKLNHCGLTNLSDELIKLTNLKQLYVRNNMFKEFPIGLTNCENLEFLDMSNDKSILNGNKFRVLPNEISNLEQLEQLILENTGIREIQSSLFELKSLKQLVLSNNQIRSLPKLVVKNSVLTMIDVSYNQISKISDEFAMLPGLKYLYLQNNVLKTIPHSLVELPLVELYLDNNDITNLSLSNMDYLEVLSLVNNRLSELHQNIFSLTKLRYLDLQANQIKKISDYIVNLQSLEVLSLGNNQISELPQNIGCLVKLKNLSLNNNELTNLPSSFLSLRNLSELNLILNELPTAFNVYCDNNDDVLAYFNRLITNYHSDASPVIVSKNQYTLSKFHLFLDSGVALISYNALTDMIEDMPIPLAGILQIGFQFIDKEGKKFVALKHEDNRTIHTAVEKGIGFGFDFMGLISSEEINNDPYLRSCVLVIADQFGESLKENMFPLTNEDLKSIFAIYINN